MKFSGHVTNTSHSYLHSVETSTQQQQPHLPLSILRLTAASMTSTALTGQLQAGSLLVCFTKRSASELMTIVQTWSVLSWPWDCAVWFTFSHFLKFQSSQSFRTQIQCPPFSHCTARHNHFLLHVPVAPCICTDILSLPIMCSYHLYAWLISTY